MGGRVRLIGGLVALVLGASALAFTPPAAAGVVGPATVTTATGLVTEVFGVRIPAACPADTVYVDVVADHRSSTPGRRDWQGVALTAYNEPAGVNPLLTGEGWQIEWTLRDVAGLEGLLVDDGDYTIRVRCFADFDDPVEYSTAVSGATFRVTGGAWAYSTGEPPATTTTTTTTTTTPPAPPEARVIGALSVSPAAGLVTDFFRVRTGRPCPAATQLVGVLVDHRPSDPASPAWVDVPLTAYQLPEDANPLLTGEGLRIEYDLRDQANMHFLTLDDGVYTISVRCFVDTGPVPEFSTAVGGRSFRVSGDRWTFGRRPPVTTTTSTTTRTTRPTCTGKPPR